MALRDALSLGGPLAALAAVDRFIVYRLDWLPDKAKFNKVPVSWHTSETANAHDPGIWTTWQNAETMAGMFGAEYGVGFVFTEADGFFFLDIDGCLVDGQWSPLAVALLQALPGAAVEVSVSGKGLHVFGRGKIPPHGCKNIPLHLEFYHEGRFVALTGNGAVGDASTDCSAGLEWLVSNYFPPSTEDEFVWTDLGVPVQDDLDLLRRMTQSKSAANTFGNRASFADLYFADIAVLARSYPDGGGRPYDASSADMALAQHLAFWTRKDCARMWRIMWESKLRRDKWFDRPEYVRDTILTACARQQEVLADRPAPVPPSMALPSPVPPPPGPAVPSQAAQVASPAVMTAMTTIGVAMGANPTLLITEQYEYFRGCVWVKSIDRIWCKGEWYDERRFKVVFGSKTFVMDNANGPTSKNAYECFTQSRGANFPKVNYAFFDPQRPAGEITMLDGQSQVNIWWPIETPSVEGDASRLTNHLRKMFPDERDYMIYLSYMAAIVQYPGRKFQWCTVLQGGQGNAKTWLAKIMEFAVGERYYHRPNAKQLGEQGLKFTGWLAEKILIVINEIRVSNKYATIDSLKPLITDDRIEVERKGVDQTMGRNVANIMMFTNHRDAVNVTINDRRYAIFYSAQQNAADVERDMNAAYFQDLWDWSEGRNAYAGQPSGWSIMNHFLRNFEIPEEFDPSKGATRAPTTSSTGAAISLSKGRAEQAIEEAVASGEPGFCGGFVSSVMLGELLDRVRVSLSNHKQREIMNDLGYRTHPAFGETGRLHNAVLPDQKKPVLYLINGHEAFASSNPSEISRMYVKAQSTLTPVPGISNQE